MRWEVVDTWEQIKIQRVLKDAKKALRVFSAPDGAWMPTTVRRGCLSSKNLKFATCELHRAHHFQYTRWCCHPKVIFSVMAVSSQIGKNCFSQFFESAGKCHNSYSHHKMQPLHKVYQNKRCSWLLKKKVLSTLIYCCNTLHLAAHIRSAWPTNPPTLRSCTCHTSSKNACQGAASCYCHSQRKSNKAFKKIFQRSPHI